MAAANENRKRVMIKRWQSSYMHVGHRAVNSQHLTTMMAILPPTSPTTVMGGFSLAIITAKESRSGYLREHGEVGLCALHFTSKSKVNLSRLGKMG